MRHAPRTWVLVVVLAAVPVATAAYTLTGAVWPGATSTFWVSIPEQGGIFNGAFEEAMAEWEASGHFQYNIVPGSYADPCGEPPFAIQNGVGFEPDFCGDAWGGSTLAATKIWSNGNTTILTGIVFNAAKPWALYEGPRPGSGSPWDFRRVAVHEVGHAVGLDHTGLVGVMRPVIADIETPEFDDWSGVAAAYGGPVPDVLSVTPRGAFAPTGPVGGPFGAEFEIYQLRNTGNAPLDFQVSDTALWTAIDGATGTLAPGAIATVGVWVNAGAAALPAGTQSSTLSFENLTSGNGSVDQLIEIEVGPADSDSDGYVNTADNCVGVPNFAQTNSDALFAGDTCQCGDLNSDWHVDVLDRVIIDRLSAARVVGTPFDQRRCSVGGDLTACDPDDSAAIQAWLARLVPDLPNRCEIAAP